MGSIASPSKSTSTNSATNNQVGVGGGTGNITLGAITTGSGKVNTTGGTSKSTTNSSSASGNVGKGITKSTGTSKGGGGGSTINPSGGASSGNVSIAISTPDAAAIQAVEDISLHALDANTSTLATSLNANHDLSAVYANVASQALQSGQNVAALAIPTYGAQNSIVPLDTVGASGAPPTTNTPNLLLLVGIGLGLYLILRK